MKKNNLIITIISIIITFLLAEILSIYCIGSIPTILTTLYLIIIFTIIEYILLLITYIIKKKRKKQKITRNEIIGRITLFIGLILILLFIMVLNIDYLNWYMYSAPFYLNVLVRTIEFIIPAIILILISTKLIKDKSKGKKKTKINKNILIILILTIFISVVLTIFKDKEELDTITYKNNTYVLLEYNMDIFNYDLNKNNYYEEDIIHPIPNKKWNVVYFNGDLFILDKQVKEATKYYQDDNNYEWYFIVDEEETEKEFSIPINNKELKYIYDMDNMKKITSLTFNDIEKMGTLKKVSKDGFISAIICLANYNDSWYYRTEIMNEKDEEYIIVLPETLNKKIDKLLYS